MKLEVFSKAQCPKCNTLKTFLSAQGLEYVELRVDENDDALPRVRDMGLQSLPVLVVDGDDDHPIVGMDMPKLEQLAK